MTSPRELAHVFLSYVDDKGEEKALFDFITFIQARNLHHMMPSVVACLERLASQEKEEQIFELKSAYQLPPDLISKIKEYTHATNSLSDRISVDPSLIGGFIARFKGTLVDASIKQQLTKLRQHLIS